MGKFWFSFLVASTLGLVEFSTNPSSLSVCSTFANLDFLGLSFRGIRFIKYADGLRKKMIEFHRPSLILSSKMQLMHQFIMVLMKLIMYVNPRMMLNICPIHAIPLMIESFNELHGKAGKAFSTLIFPSTIPKAPDNFTTLCVIVDKIEDCSQDQVWISSNSLMVSKS